MKKITTTIFACLMFIISLFAFTGCGNENKNENLWYCYQIWDLESGTLDLKKNDIEYYIEFFPEDKTYVRNYTEDGETTEMNGTYTIGDSGQMFIYLESGTLFGIFTIDGEEASLSGISSMYTESFRRNK